MYDYLVVGSGLFGSVFAYEANKIGKKVLVIEKRNHIGGNIYTEKIENIDVHKYGAHIFHTSDKHIWDYVNSICLFDNFINSPIANFRGELYSLPFNMYTFNKMWGVITPKEAKDKINEQKSEIKLNPKNLEEQAISLVGRDIYEKLIKGYTEKQWGRDCRDLPKEIINRIPVRFSYNNNYFNDIYQGIPREGYTYFIEKLLDGIEIKLETNYFDNKEYFNSIAKNIVYTGSIDEFYNYCFGKLNYRSVYFEEICLDIESYQGNAVVNYTDIDIPWTRIIEHKWFSKNANTSKTIISKEYSVEYDKNNEPYYPINNAKNNSLFEKYKVLSYKDNNVIFGGRLAEYKYYNMDEVVKNALKTFKAVERIDN